ncbi:hypothetical protein QYM36_011152 [Artemia franciscana]|uniref:Heat shock protein 75 kDa, mitochondrial n=1 Tax=Artemia franciscana TaxID=6661 RepID=A0AA88HWR5_ARTSF|nr:hypothetical protein QYM36_011152 [Artemia franciscana]
MASRRVFLSFLKNKNYWKNPARVLRHGNYLNNYSQAAAIRCLSTSSVCRSESNSDYHTIIKDVETGVGSVQKKEFQAETRMLLDIVAKSLYSEREVFIRELISNASDALEKLRYLTLTGEKLVEADRPLEIHIATDPATNTFIVQDTGVGMTSEEMIENLGTIARSGSKAFLEQLKDKPDAGGVSNIIGQFGVGFYSAFMVADRIDVYSKSSRPDSKGFKWTSDGSGTYEIQEAEGVQPGTKIVIHLKSDAAEFSKDDRVKEVIKRYSNFVGSPIFVNGNQANTVQAVWLMDPKEVTDEMHTDFYRFVANSFDRPRFTLHYKTDAPINVRALLYIPESKPGLFDMSRETETSVSLYCRKVLIKSRADKVLPKWLRFVKGVVDSEDIPLNLSRELLQDGAIIRKLRTVLTNRILRFLNDKANKKPEEYFEFYQDYGLFLKEGIVTGTEQVEKEEIAKLLRYESSGMPPGQKVGLADYCSRLRPGQRDIYYLAAPSRELAESSPYLEALREKDVEVLFCYEPYDELVLLQLRQYDRKNVTSVEKEIRTTKSAGDVDDLGEGSLSKSEIQELTNWLSATLSPKANRVTVTNKLASHPCVVTVEEMGAARHFVKTQFQQIPESQRYQILQPQLEINPR